MKKQIFLLTVLLLFGAAFSAVTEEDEEGIGLGLVIKSMSPPEMKSLSVEKGALVLVVIPESPAQEAGFKEQDVVIKANGKNIENAKELNDLVENLKEGDKLTATVIRDGKKTNLTARIHYKDYDENTYTYTFSYPETGMKMHPMPPAMPEMRDMMQKGGWLGCNLDFINDQLKEFFEVDAGALVKRVMEDSPAEKAGLKAGDVIVKINTKKIDDSADVMRTVNYYDPGEKVAVHVVRKGKKKTVWVKLGKKPFAGKHNMTVVVNNNDDDEDVEVRVAPGPNVNVRKFMFHPHPGMMPGKQKEIKLELFII